MPLAVSDLRNILRHPRPALLAGLLVLAAGLWAIGMAPAGVFYDDGIYLTLGQSLAKGAGFRYLNLPGSPAATHYPPGYPTLLALCWWVGSDLPRVLLLAKVLNAALMAAGAGGLAWLLAEGDIPPFVAGAGAVAGALAVPVLALSTIPFSEPLFFALLVTGAILAARSLRSGARVTSYVLTGLLWGVLFLVRSLGAAMIPVGFLLLARQRRWRAAIFSAAAALALCAPWILWSSRHATDVPAILSGSYGSYTGWYAESVRSEGPGLILRIAAHNLEALRRPLGVLLAPPGPPWLSWIVLPAGLVLLALGAAGLARITALLAGTLAFYLVVVLFWPYPPDRFLWGIWPIVTSTLALGFVTAWRARGDSVVRRVAVMTLLVLGGLGVLGYLLREGTGFLHRSWEGAQRASAASMEPAVRWVRAHTEPDAVVATVDDPLMYLYTGRRSVPALAWTAAEHVRPQSVERADSNLTRILEEFSPALVILPGGGTPEAFAVERMWHERKLFELIDTLPGGGAVFRPVRPVSPP